MIKELINYLFNNYYEVFDKTITHIWISTFSLAISSLITWIYFTQFQSSLKKLLKSYSTLLKRPFSFFIFMAIFLILFGSGEYLKYVMLISFGSTIMISITHVNIKKLDSRIFLYRNVIGIKKNVYFKTVISKYLSGSIEGSVRHTFNSLIVAVTISNIIGVEGLGAYLYRGFNFNRSYLVLLSLLLLFLISFGFTLCLKAIRRIKTNKYIQIVTLQTVILLLIGFTNFLVIDDSIYLKSMTKEDYLFKLGVEGEFISRDDGYIPFARKYGLNFHVQDYTKNELYSKLFSRELDFIIATATDPELSIYGITTIIDDKNFFLKYYCHPVIQKNTVRTFPLIKPSINVLSGKITNKVMQELIFQVNEQKQNPKKVALTYLKSKNLLRNDEQSFYAGKIVIGIKPFIEGEILSHMIGILLKYNLNLEIEFRPVPFGPASIEMLKSKQIDILPDYTGNWLAHSLDKSSRELEVYKKNDSLALHYIKENFETAYGIEWLEPFGLENGYRLVTLDKLSKELSLKKISDLELIQETR